MCPELSLAPLIVRDTEMERELTDYVVQSRQTGEPIPKIIDWIEGPVGVRSRNFRNAKIYSLVWNPCYSLKDGISPTYPRVEEQANEAKNI